MIFFLSMRSVIRLSTMCGLCFSNKKGVLLFNIPVFLCFVSTLLLCSSLSFVYVAMQGSHQATSCHLAFSSWNGCSLSCCSYIFAVSGIPSFPVHLLLLTISLCDFINGVEKEQCCNLLYQIILVCFTETWWCSAIHEVSPSWSWCW